MKLKHYSVSPNFNFQKEWDYSVFSIPRGDKPNGFWVSVEGEDDWRNWCETEEWRTESLDNEYDVVLSDSANILYLNSDQDILEFTREYLDTKTDPLSIAERRAGIRVWDSTRYILWNDLRKKYDGIIIAPYQWSCRLSKETEWYYTWDVASGCIWNLSAISSVTAVNDNSQKLHVL